MEFSPLKSVESKTNKRYCCVPSCKSKASKQKTLRFHSFPDDRVIVKILNNIGVLEEMSLKQAWKMRLLIRKNINKSMKVCSLHFSEEDYSCLGYSHKRYLNRTAVPSKNLPISLTPKKKEEINESRQKRLVKRLCREIDAVSNEKDCSTSEAVDDDKELLQEQSFHEEKNVGDLDSVEALNVLQNFNILKNTNDVGCQVCTTSYVTIIDQISTDKQLNSLTGLHSFDLLNTIVNLVDITFKENKQRKLSTKHRVVLTFMKLKLNISYEILSLAFGNITSQTSRIIFCKMLQQLYKILKSVIVFPSACEIQNNMPICFEDFQNVRIVLNLVCNNPNVYVAALNVTLTIKVK